MVVQPQYKSGAGLQSIEGSTFFRKTTTENEFKNKRIAPNMLIISIIALFK